MARFAGGLSNLNPKLSPFAAGEEDDGSLAARFAGWLTETYAARQSAAAEKCGVAPGEAWRAALAAADACGAAQVLHSTAHACQWP